MAGHYLRQAPRGVNAFNDKPQFQGFMKPCRYEGEVQNLEVYGEIPKSVDGTFYRVMPDPQFAPFVEDDPVRSASHVFCIRADFALVVVQRRWQHQRLSHPQRQSPLQATLCAHGEIHS